MDYLKKTDSTTAMPSHERNLELFQLLETAQYRLAKLKDNPGADSAELERWETQAEEVRNAIALANEKLVWNITNKYAGKNSENKNLDQDLFQCGFMGLMKAVDRFDHSRGNRFSTFAYRWIRGAITRALAKQSRTIRIPEEKIAELNALKKTMERLSKSGGCEPTAQEIALEMGLSVSKVSVLLALDQQTISLNNMAGDARGAEMLDFCADTAATNPAEEADRTNRSELVNEFMATLTEREREVIIRRYGIKDGHPCTLEELALEFGISGERIRQIQDEAVAKMFRFREARELNGLVKAAIHGGETTTLGVVPPPASITAPAVSRLKMRAVEKNENHHLWNNNGVWYTDFMVKNEAGKSKRVRNPLYTNDVVVARRRRDVLIGLYRRFSGN